MSIRSFIKIRTRPALLFVWAVTMVFLFASVKTTVGAPLLTAALDGHHVPVVMVEHGHVHVSFSHGAGRHHHDHGLSPFVSFNSTVEHGHDGDHESHLQEYVEEVAPTKRLKSSPLACIANVPAFSLTPRATRPKNSERLRPAAADTSLLKLSTVVLLN